MERDGVIHVETNHPRSSIVIIRSQEDENPPKKINHESSFLLPSVHNMFTNRDENDYFSKDQNHNSIKNDELGSLAFAYKERTDFVDRVDENENDSIKECILDTEEDHDNITATSDDQICNTEQRNDEESQCVQKEEKSQENEVNSSSRLGIYRIENSNSRFSNKSNVIDSGCLGDGYQDENKMDDSCYSDEEDNDPEKYGSCLKQLYPEPYEKKYEW